MGVRLRNIPIYSVPKERLHSAAGFPAYGLAFKKYGWVRQDLPPRVKKHVILHERIHVKYGRGEILTNLIAGARDPRGWMATAFATIKDPQRRAAYARNAKLLLFRKRKNI